jgi:hypothetical protein
VAEGVWLGVDESVGDRLGVPEGVRVAESEGVVVGEAVGVLEGVSEPESEGVTEGERVGDVVSDGVVAGDLVGEAVAVELGDRRVCELAERESSQGPIAAAIHAG